MWEQMRTRGEGVLTLKTLTKILLKEPTDISSPKFLANSNSKLYFIPVISPFIFSCFYKTALSCKQFEMNKKWRWRPQNVEMKLSIIAFNCLLLIKWKMGGGVIIENVILEGGLSMWEPLENKRGEGVKNPIFLWTLFMNGP